MDDAGGQTAPSAEASICHSSFIIHRSLEGLLNGSYHWTGLPALPPRRFEVVS
jgi:hypothetical protein